MKTSYDTKNKAFLRLREIDDQGDNAKGETNAEQAMFVDVDSW